MRTILCILLLLYWIQKSSAIQCYTCSASETDIDQSCIDDVEKAVYIDCNKKYCTVQRTEYLEPKDRVQSIYRGCEDKPPFMNQIIEDEIFRTYYVACTSDLCNGGSGKSGGDSGGGSLGDKSTIYCPGTGNHGNLPTVNAITLILTAILTIIIIY